MPIKSVKMKISKNKRILFFHVPRITQPKNQVPRSKGVTHSPRTDRQTHMKVKTEGFAHLFLQSSVLCCLTVSLTVVIEVVLFCTHCTLFCKVISSFILMYVYMPWHPLKGGVGALTSDNFFNGFGQLPNFLVFRVVIFQSFEDRLGI